MPNTHQTGVGYPPGRWFLRGWWSGRTFISRRTITGRISSWSKKASVSARLHWFCHHRGEELSSSVEFRVG